MIKQIRNMFLLLYNSWLPERPEHLCVKRDSRLR